jgi:predicted ribosome quality control (RQC) complex YloA/Tae2 family protein
VDELFLAHYLAELGPVVAGARLDRAYQYGRHDLALRLWLRPGRATLLLSADAEAPLVALIDEEPAETRTRSALLEAVRSRCLPGILAAVDKAPGERVVTVTFARGPGADSVRHRLVCELIPRAAALFLLDGDGRIVAATGPGLPGRRRLGTGKTWVAPLLPPARPGPPEIAGLATPSRREVEVRAARSGGDLGAARAELERELGAPRPTLHALGDGKLVPTPVPFRSLGGTAESFPSFRALGAAWYRRAVQDRRAGLGRDRLRAALARRLARVERAVARVEQEGAAADDHERDRRWGELLLAYQVTARRDGDRVHVPDPEVEGATCAIDLVDPARTLVGNAEALFERYRRKKRTAAAARARLEALLVERDHLEELDALVAQAEGGELDELAEELRAEGLLDAGAARPAGRRGSRPQSVPAPLEPRRFRSSDGCEILVGRTGRGNDHLTFVLARADDFWLHADAPGSHVVLRNPGRGDEPSAEALAEAAALAAHFSRLRGATKAEVRWTRRRQVQRPSGAPPGRVLLRAWRSVVARPALAAERFDLRCRQP